ncbi:MAG: 3-methyl-2-oxobutanoate hydroxymethyltransferase [Deltaproteobacteria bacterium]|nr:3-methyl-2-oxobutanoate hydroxymethyltransferase [Deltaproteobacteria bacterium]
MDRRKLTIPDFYEKKRTGDKVTMLTAYDYPMAIWLDGAGIEMVLVGDSLGMVVLGYDSTVPVTMDEMIHHCRAVRRGVKYAFVIGDMPFMSYNVSIEEAIRNAGRFMKEAGCDAVKLEGGSEMAATVAAIVEAGIPVVAHIGLTPQTATKLGGFKAQGKDAASAQKLLDSARALEQAGAFCVVMECIPDQLAAKITSAVSMITIGIGAGPDCDGQVLVTNDMLGMFDRFTPKFVKKYINLTPEIDRAVKAYINEVKEVKFPGPEHVFTITPDNLEKLA